METIRQFFASPEFAAILSSIIAFLSANLVTIILFAVKFIRLKVKETREKEIHNKVIEERDAEYQARLDAMFEKMDGSLARLENTVTGKIKELDDAEQQAIKDEAIDLKKAIKETNKTIDDILEEPDTLPQEQEQPSGK